MTEIFLACIEQHIRKPLFIMCLRKLPVVQAGKIISYLHLTMYAETGSFVVVWSWGAIHTVYPVPVRGHARPLLDIRPDGWVRGADIKRRALERNRGFL